MHMSHIIGRITIITVLAIAISALSASTPCLAAGQYQNAAVLKASKVLPSNLLSGQGYTVDKKTTNDGFINRYQVNSVYGRYSVLGNLALIKLAGEIKAIAAMSQVEEGDTFQKSLETSAKKTGRGIKKLFSDPGGAMEGAATGLGRLFDRAGESLSGSGPSQAEDSRAKQFIGFSKAKREIAAKFGVDVYSANPELQKELERLAWADYAGGISMGAATAVVPGGAGLVLSTAGGARLLNDVMATTPPAELRMMNRDKLRTMRIPPDLAEVFVENPIYSPREQTIVVGAMEALKGVANRKLMIKVALQAPRREISFIISKVAIMYAGYHKRVRPLAQLKPVGRVLYAVDKKGRPVVALPADYVLWSERLAGALAWIDKDTGNKPGELWITGVLSPRAAERLKAAGWKVRPKASDKLLK
jgi:hypothetical protein